MLSNSAERALVRIAEARIRAAEIVGGVTAAIIIIITIFC